MLLSVRSVAVMLVYGSELGWSNVFESELSPDYSAKLWTNTITRPDMRRHVTCLVLCTKKSCGLLLDVLHRLNYFSSVAVIISVAMFKDHNSHHFRLVDRNFNKVPPILTKPTMTCSKVHPGRAAYHSPPSSAGGHGRVELHFYPPSGPHRACNGITLPH